MGKRRGLPHRIVRDGASKVRIAFARFGEEEVVVESDPE
jgi:hypothetical protein